MVGPRVVRDRVQIKAALTIRRRIERGRHRASVEIATVGFAEIRTRPSIAERETHDLPRRETEVGACADAPLNRIEAMIVDGSGFATLAVIAAQP
jgi:hypothetical protein